MIFQRCSSDEMQEQNPLSVSKQTFVHTYTMYVSLSCICPYSIHRFISQINRNQKSDISRTSATVANILHVEIRETVLANYDKMNRMRIIHTNITFTAYNTFQQTETLRTENSIVSRRITRRNVWIPIFLTHRI